MDSSQLYINKLPISVLEEIFMNLLPKDSVSHPYLVFPYITIEDILSSTCQRWSDLLSTSARLWQRVELRVSTDRPFQSDFLYVLYQKAPAIKHLSIRGSVGNVSTRVFLNFPTFANVKSLQFEVGPNLTPMEWALVVELFPKVEKFTNNLIGYHDLDNRTLQLLAAGWPNLIDIDISYCNRLTGAGLIDFVTIANQLQSIDISKIRGLTDHDIDVIARLLSKTLKSIKFGNDPEELSGSAVRSLVQNCSQLEEICIWSLSLKTNVGHLKHLVNLKTLGITLGRTANCEGLEEIFSRPLGQLRVLEIRNVTNYTDSLLTQIANGCPLLDNLCLSTYNYNNPLVTDLGLDEIVNKCRNLTQLRLDSFPLLTGSSFIGSRDKLPKLKYLRILNCENLDEGAIMAEFAGVDGMTIELNI